MEKTLSPAILLRTMKRLLVIIGLLVIFGASYVYGYNRVAINPDLNHTHADFAVWINGTQLDFAQEKYMSTPPTTASALPSWMVPVVSAHEGEEEELHAEIPGREYLHLHDMNGHVVHRHKPGLGFGDFLSSIGFTVTDRCITTDTKTIACNGTGLFWRLFVNGKEVTPAQLNYMFNDGDQLLLTYGADDAEVQRELKVMTDDACKYSKTCPGRGAPPTENCIADPTVPCKVQ